MTKLITKKYDALSVKSGTNILVTNDGTVFEYLDLVGCIRFVLIRDIARIEIT